MKIYYTKNNNNTTIKYYCEKKEDRHYIHRLLIKKLRYNDWMNYNKKHFKKAYMKSIFNDTSKDYIRKVICECIKEDLQELQAKNKI